MKSASVLCFVLAAGGAEGFAPNSQFTKRDVETIATTTPPVSVTKSASTLSLTTRLDPLQSSTTSDESSTSRIASSLSSTIPKSLDSNETSLLAQATVLDDNNEISGDQPNWLEPLAWRAVIVVLCALWASNFAAAKLVMAEPGVDSSLYAVSRFGVAATSLAPFAIRAVLQGKEERNEAGDVVSRATIMDIDTLKEAIICGSWVAFGYLGQTLGLMTTTASKSCVICSMHCVFVAMVAELWRVQKAVQEETSCLITDDDNCTKFDFMQLVPAAVAVLGVAIVELQGAGGAPTIGDALSFAQPIGFGMGYLVLENIMARKPEAALPVSAIKLAVVLTASFLMFEASPLIHGGTVSDLALRLPDFSPILHSSRAMVGILYTGLVTTALALWVESVAFARVPATDASLILTTEPLFAAGCGAIALGETFGTSDYIGASLIVGACALSVFLESPEAESSAEPATDF